MADPGDHAATFELTEASRREQEEQEKLLREFEMRRKIRSTVVPTDDGKVRTLLRQMGEPITLFGEREMERRDRLRRIVAEREAAGDLADGAPMVGQVVDEVVSQKELFYTEGPPQLKEARLQLAQWSLTRAAARLRAARQERQQLQVLRERKRARVASEAAASQLAQFSSEIGDARPLGGCAWSPDGALLATAGWGGNVNTWHAADCKHALRFRGSVDRLTDVTWHPQARLTHGEGQLQMATGCVDGSAGLWGGAGQPLAKLEGHTDRLGRIRFHPMGRHLATASFDTTWRLWDVEAATCLQEQEGHSRAVYDVDCHPDGGLAVSVGLDAIGRVWDLRTGRSVQVLEGHVKPILSVRCAPDGYHIATGGEDHTVKVWDLRKKAVLYTIAAHRSLVSVVQWQPGTGYYLLTAGYDNVLKVWSSRDFQLLKTLAGHEGKIMGADICPTSAGLPSHGAGSGSEYQAQHLVASCSYDRTIKLWQPEEVADMGLDMTEVEQDDMMEEGM